MSDVTFAPPASKEVLGQTYSTVQNNGNLTALLIDCDA